MHDICEGMGVEWQQVKRIITADQKQMIGPSHMDRFRFESWLWWEVFAQGQHGLGCSCGGLGVKYEFMDSIQRDNDRLRKILTGMPSDVRPTTIDRFSSIILGGEGQVGAPEVLAMSYRTLQFSYMDGPFMQCAIRRGQLDR